MNDLEAQHIIEIASTLGYPEAMRRLANIATTKPAETSVASLRH